ncbi:hypothetical protein HMPREF9141_1292 [Prevotella multiformis DSM 16608]|uniref:Uncharacterized protein n=1 Tax=Prevotella multiformis DSM 16608 TaxID=888743 RepID=F0F6S5_9BACT|nr:hypothetical protein HMPREF9141_1292 [Prevotella multiformis DSM 16608]
MSFYKHKHQNKEIPPQENGLICRLFACNLEYKRMIPERTVPS